MVSKHDRVKLKRASENEHEQKDLDFDQKSNPVKPVHLSDIVACLVSLVLKLSEYEMARKREAYMDGDVAAILSRVAALEGVDKTDTGWYDVGARGSEIETPLHTDEDE